MKNWLIIILCLIVLGIVLFLFGKYSPLHMVNWLTAIIGIIIGAGTIFHSGVSWGKFLDQTL